VLFSPLLRPALPRLPSLCALCGGWGEQRVCSACMKRWAGAAHRCARCAIGTPSATAQCGTCLLEPPPYARAVAAFDYAAPWDGLIARFKFNDALDLASPLTQRLLCAIRASGVTLPELLLPVPLSETRLRERGYNQAWQIARRLGKALALRADAHLLLRTKDTPHQLALPPNARTANVRGAFAVEPLRLRELRDAQVAVVDDVLTTGATAAEVTRTLLQAGAASVQVWVLARTPRPDR
jgi:ComF family protein